MSELTQKLRSLYTASQQAPGVFAPESARAAVELRESLPLAFDELERLEQRCSELRRCMLLAMANRLHGDDLAKAVELSESKE